MKVSFWINKLISTRLFRAAGVYTISNVVSSAVPFLLLPVLTRYLTPEDFGRLSIFQVFVTLVGPFVGMSVHGAIGRQYFNENTKFAKYVGNGFLVLLVSTTIVLVSFVLLSGPISSISSIQSSWIPLICLISFGQFVIQVALVIWQMQGRAIRYAAFSMAQTVTNAGISIGLVVFAGQDWHGVIVAQLTSFLLFAVIGFFMLTSEGLVKFSFEKDYIINALRFGVPLIPHALGGWAIDMIDRLFIANFSGIGVVGIYSVGYQVGKIIGILESSFINAWVPYLYENLRKNDFGVKVKLVRIAYAYFLGLILLALMLAFMAPWLMSVFVSKDFYGAYKFVVWIALGYAACGMYKMMAGYVFYVEKTTPLAMVTFSTALVSLVLTYFMTKYYGPMGAAISTTLSFLFSFLATWIISNRLYPMPWLDPCVLRFKG